ADLRHAVHGLAGGAAEGFRDLDLVELREDRPDSSPDGASERVRGGRPGGPGALSQQAVAVDDAEMIDTVGVHDRAGKTD
ncbi:hypothetical protein, partial [Vibrio cholerae]|uniref:hypothetical protein n=1 Tax=Vibrio cholerae TaxID=666 RepID=UPI001F3DA820